MAIYVLLLLKVLDLSLQSSLNLEQKQLLYISIAHSKLLFINITTQIRLMPIYLLWVIRCYIYINMLLILVFLRRALCVILVFEFLSWIYVLILILDSEEMILKYVIIQRFVTLLFLSGILFSSYIMILVRVLVKIGIPPFHSWAVNVRHQLRKNSFWFLLTIHKLLPTLILIIIVFLRSKTLLIYLVFVVMTLLSSNRTIKLLLISSIRHSVWVLLGITQSLYLGLKYWIVYSLLFLILISGFSLEVRVFSQVALVLLVRWLVWAGLPPFSIFWLKLLIVLTFLPKWRVLVILLLIVRVYAMWAYIRILALQVWGNTRKPAFSSLFVMSRRLLFLI